MTATITIGGHILRPGLLTLPPGTERHVIDGGTMLVLRLAAGDGLRIVDSEGGQTAQIAAFGKNGKCDAGLLNATDHKTNAADGIKKIIVQNRDDSRFAAALRDCDIGGICAINAHGDNSKAGIDGPVISNLRNRRQIIIARFFAACPIFGDSNAAIARNSTPGSQKPLYSVKPPRVCFGFCARRIKLLMSQACRIFGDSPLVYAALMLRLRARRILCLVSLLPPSLGVCET